MTLQHSIDRPNFGPDFDALSAGAREASEFLKALAHEGRLRILCRLIGGERTVTDIEKLLNLRQPAVSQLLARLRADGLVETRREGQNIFYSLARPEVREVIGVLYLAFCRGPPWPDRVANKRVAARAAVHPKQAGRRVRSVPARLSAPAAR